MPKCIEIGKKYGEKIVLEGFCCEFPEGKTTAVKGASGCGKTTLLNILMGLEKADRGALEGFSDKKISAVFQEDRLCENLTVSANIRLVTGKKLSKEEIDAELSRVGLEGCAKKPVRELSGGMKRRAALVRALAADFDILFLDEPFKGLDAAVKQRVIEYTREKSAGKTVIFVTHDESELALADSVTEL